MKKMKTLLLHSLDRFLNTFGYKLHKIPKGILSNEYKKFEWFYESVDKDIKKRNFNQEKQSLRRKTNKKSLEINWVVPFIEKGGGGHQTIFRLIKYLQDQGHQNKIIVFSPGQNMILSPKIKKFINEHYLDVSSIDVFEGSHNMQDSDIHFATSWDSAYEVYRQDNTLLKAYLIQDYEPSFFAKGILSILAKQTYKFGFYGVVASNWLQQQVLQQHNMPGDFFSLGVDEAYLKYEKTSVREEKTIAVYIRSHTPRRATELLVPTLRKLKQKLPDLQIVTFGQQEKNPGLDFPHTHLGIISKLDMASLFSKATITLVCSLTNYSLIPQEAMACGSLVIDLDLPNNRLAHQEILDKGIVLAAPHLKELSKTVQYYLENPSLRKEIANAGKKYAQNLTWEKSFAKIGSNLHNQFTQ